MIIKKLDEYRDITSTGFIIQRKPAGTWESRRPVGSVWLPSIGGSGYRQIQVNGKKTAFHRVLWETFNGSIPEGMDIDHKNGNKIDNRLENLRVVSRADNQRAYKKTHGGSSKYRGVYWHRDTKKWMAYICHDGKHINCGYHNRETEAALARDDKAIALGWPDEGLNFPLSKAI